MQSRVDFSPRRFNRGMPMAGFVPVGPVAICGTNAMAQG